MPNQTSLLPDRVVTGYSLDTIRAHTFQVALEFLHKYPVYFCWGEGATGDHSRGKALDFMTYALGGGVDSPGPMRNALGTAIANELWNRRKELGIAYVIWRQRIISIRDNDYGDAGVWNEMEDRGSATKNHFDHVHGSFIESPPAFSWKPERVDDDVAINREDAKLIASELLGTHVMFWGEGENRTSLNVAELLGQGVKWDRQRREMGNLLRSTATILTKLGAAQEDIDKIEAAVTEIETEPPVGSIVKENVK